VLSYRITVMTGAQIGSRGDVCPQPVANGAHVQRPTVDLTRRTDAFGIRNKWNHPAFAARQHREAPG
jgi:hypothetical protein